MKQRGRGKTPQGTEQNRYPAPSGMDAQRASAWDEIMQAMPDGWFNAGNLMLLEALVNRKICVRLLEITLTEELSKPAAGRDLAVMTGTAAFLRQEVSAMKALATSLALTQTAQVKPKPAAKPLAWKSDEDDGTS